VTLGVGAGVGERPPTPVWTAKFAVKFLTLFALLNVRGVELAVRTQFLLVLLLVRDVLREVAALYLGTADEPTRLNVVLTDGELFVSSRWGHTLHMAKLPAAGVVTADGPARGIVVASEPVTLAGWAEMPDRSVVVDRTDMSASVVAIGSS